MWLTLPEARELLETNNGPMYVYDRAQLEDRAQALLDLSLPFDCTVRYAVKANSHPEIIKLFDTRGLHFDASSSYEATLLLGMGIPGEKISLSSQRPAHNLPELLDTNMQYVATSMHQLELYAETAKPDSTVGLRVNTGFGSGHNNRTITCGVASGFGLWHEYLEDALELAKRHGLTIDRMHTHIGSGADPAVWGRAMDTALQIVARMPDVHTLDMGGGYKVARTKTEQETDMERVGSIFAEKLRDFADTHNRKLRLEIEPGGWLVAHAGCLLAEVVDIVDTGKNGYTFLRISTGMNDFLRAAMYGVEHEIQVLNDASERAEYVVVGHNCESSDIITTMPRNPEEIRTQLLNKATIGDMIVIGDAGAYCASMSTKGYNAFPNAQEVFV